MKAFRMLGHSIRDAFKSVFRNFSLSLASISCLVITLIIVAASLVVTVNVDKFTRNMKKELTIVVFLDYDADEEDAKKVINEVKKLPNIDSYSYKSKESIKEEESKQSSVLNEILETIPENENPFKATLEVKVKDMNNIANTADKLKKIDKVSIVKYGEEYVDKLLATFNVIEKVAYGMVIALFIVTVFLVINTIKLTIFSRKREISIMRLVGASNFSIKTPFIIEGMFLGLLGSIIPILITCYGYTTLYKHFNGYLIMEMNKLIPPEPFIYMVSGVILVIGIIVGMIGSSSAVRKYLKV